MELTPAAVAFMQQRDPLTYGLRPAAWRERRQMNLPEHKTPVVQSTYEARTVRRPGTIEDWASFLSRVVGLAEDLYRDARVLTSKRQQMRETPAGSRTFLEAQRIYGEVNKRAVKHCQDLAHVLLSTGLPREHIDGYLTRCGMENNCLPEYGIAVLYCKLMGIPFREEVPVPPGPDEPPDSPGRLVMHDRRTHWAAEIDPKDLDDFYWTMRVLQERLPSLMTRFHRSAARASLALSPAFAA